MDKALNALDCVRTKLTPMEYESIAQHLRKQKVERLAPHPVLHERPQKPQSVPVAYPPPYAEFAPSAPPLPTDKYMYTSE